MGGLRVFTTAPGTTSILKGELPSGLRVFTTAPGTTQTEKTRPILLISRVLTRKRQTLNRIIFK